MTLSVSQTKFSNQGDRRRVARDMVRTVKLLRDNQLWTAALSLVMTFTEALAGGGSGKSFERVIDDVFPGLKHELSRHGVSVADFYKAYRDKVVHLFNFSGEFGIARSTGELESSYFGPIHVQGIDRTFKCVNIDRLIKDFVAYAQRFFAPSP